MSTTYGVTPTGFVKPQLTDILTDLQSAIQASPNFGANFDVSTESPMGQILGLIADRLSDVWDQLEAVYAAFDPAGATGQSLINISALTGTQGPEQPTPSTVLVNLTGTAHAVISPATFATNDALGSQFTMNAAVTLDGGGNATGVACTAVTPGPVIATAGTLTVIVTPRAGLATVTNPLDAVVGLPLESDAALRLRRENELHSSGNAANQAIKAAILALKDSNGNLIASGCIVFENDTDTTDVNGLPPHSINVLVNAPTGSDIDTAIAGAIFASKAAGIQTYGGSSVVVTDSSTIDHTISFDRPTQLLVYVTLNLVIDTTKWPADGVNEVKNALLAYGTASLVDGFNVVASALSAQAFQISGVLDSPPALIGLSASPSSSATLTVTNRQIALLDASRITVNTTPGTP